MDRRSALKSLGIASGIAFVPLGLLSQPDDKPLIITHQSGATWGAESDRQAEYLRRMYPEKHTYKII